MPDECISQEEIQGAGKSLLGQHFLSDGVDNGETVVYIHGEETETSIIRNAQELQIDLTDAEFLDLGPETDFFTEDISYELVDPVHGESRVLTASRFSRESNGERESSSMTR